MGNYLELTKLKQSLKMFKNRLNSKKQGITSIFGGFFQTPVMKEIAENVAKNTPDASKLLSNVADKLKIQLPKAESLMDMVGLNKYLDARPMMMPDINELTRKPAIELANLQNIEKVKVEFKNPIVFEQLNLNEIYESQSKMLKEMLAKQKDSLKVPVENYQTDQQQKREKINHKRRK